MAGAVPAPEKENSGRMAADKGMKLRGAEGPGAFRGLRLTGLPCHGRLEARVRFAAMRLAAS